MTREEAITLINSAKLMLINPTDNEPISDLYTALDMAIKALEQKPCEWGRMTFDATTGTSVFEFSDGTIKQVKQAELEQCEDTISREAVNTLVDELARAISDERCCIPQRERSTGDIMHDIFDLPSVTPSRQNIPKGKTARCIGCRFLKECCAEMVEK